MRTAATIVRGSEYYNLYPNGQIGRCGVMPSDDWKVIGAVTLNNFGATVRRYSLAQILANPQCIPWQHKNGKQKTFVMDIDHGTKRMWASPEHYIY